MFKITPIQEKSLQKEICLICNAEFREDAFAYQMYDMDSGDIMGMSQFEIGEHGYIYDIKEVPGRDDFEAMFILARQTMNFIDLCGVHRAFFDAECDNETLIKAIGFSRNVDGRYEMDLTDFFKEPCQHSKK